MQYEVEQKFRVDDLGEVEDQLSGLGARFGERFEQVDRYFNHPSRDFASTDEAIRVRQVGTQCRITYKGPKVDKTTKTRQEIELPLGDGPDVAEQWTTLLDALGFTPVREVRKLRRKGHLDWQDAEVEIALDEVDGLGTFAELEVAVDADNVETAKSRILSLGDEVGLLNAERRSYLELLIEAGG